MMFLFKAGWSLRFHVDFPGYISISIVVPFIFDGILLGICENFPGCTAVHPLHHMDRRQTPPPRQLVPLEPQASVLHRIGAISFNKALNCNPKGSMG